MNSLDKARAICSTLVSRVYQKPLLRMDELGSKGEYNSSWEVKGGMVIEAASSDIFKDGGLVYINIPNYQYFKRKTPLFSNTLKQ